jgi:hypothetical protein
VKTISNQVFLSGKTVDALRLLRIRNNYRKGTGMKQSVYLNMD